MIKLSDNESQALKIIRSWQERFRNSPTVSELSEEMAMPESTTRYTLNSLLEKGFIDMQHPSKGTSQRLMIVPLFWE